MSSIEVGASSSAHWCWSRFQRVCKIYMYILACVIIRGKPVSLCFPSIQSTSKMVPATRALPVSKRWLQKVDPVAWRVDCLSLCHVAGTRVSFGRQKNDVNRKQGSRNTFLVALTPSLSFKDSHKLPKVETGAFVAVLHEFVKWYVLGKMTLF